MSGEQFTVPAPSDEGFYIIVAAGKATVYEDYTDAVGDIQTKLTGDTEGFLAEVAIDADGGEDIAVTLEQVSWQRVIADMTESTQEDQ